jgi:hypothetical protein
MKTDGTGEVSPVLIPVMIIDYDTVRLTDVDAPETAAKLDRAMKTDPEGKAVLIRRVGGLSVVIPRSVWLAFWEGIDRDVAWAEDMYMDHLISLQPSSEDPVDEL